MEEELVDEDNINNEMTDHYDYEEDSLLSQKF